MTAPTARDQALAALTAHPLCDACLGRLFGKLGYGLTNAGRGAALKTALVLDADHTLKTEKNDTALNVLAPSSEYARELLKRAGNDVEKEECWLCEGLLDEVPHLADLAVEAMDEYEYSTFLIGTKIDDEIKGREEALWSLVDPRGVEPTRSELNREIGKAALKKNGKDVDLAKPDIAAIVDTRYDIVQLEVAPLFIYGRYRKHERGIPQTIWLCNTCQGKGCERCNDTGKMYPTSVQEIIAEAPFKAAKGEESFFHGMGREDIDARMLGNGRPFVLEIRRPRIRSLDLAALETEINTLAADRVDVSELRFSDNAEVIAIKERRSTKRYRATVAFETPVDEARLREAVASLNGTVIKQQTPTRVAHRRADLVRERAVHEIVVEDIDGTHANIVVHGDAGLYIKELMHGDGGRTKPSIAALVDTPCTVEALDVIQLYD